jgi:hypothetical protein
VKNLVVDLTLKSKSSKLRPQVRSGCLFVHHQPDPSVGLEKEGQSPLDLQGCVRFLFSSSSLSVQVPKNIV